MQAADHRTHYKQSDHRRIKFIWSMVALTNAVPLLLLVLQPVAEVILLCALGAWLANPRVNVLTQSARDNLNKVSKRELDPFH